MLRTALDESERKRLLVIAKKVVAEFTLSDWRTLGAHTGSLDIVTGRPRLLRSLDFGDDDYEGEAHMMLNDLVKLDHNNLAIIERFVAERYGVDGENVSTAPSQSRTVVFQPSVCLKCQTAASKAISSP